MDWKYLSMGAISAGRPALIDVGSPQLPGTRLPTVKIKDLKFHFHILFFQGLAQVFELSVQLFLLTTTQLAPRTTGSTAASYHYIKCLVYSMM